MKTPEIIAPDLIQNQNQDISALVRTSSGTPEGEDWRLFKPRLDDDGAAYDQLRQVLKSSKEDALIRLGEFVSSIKNTSGHALRLRVSAAILRDLLHIGWEFNLDSHWIYVRPPKSTSPATRKESIRQQLLFGRNDQLSEDLS